MGRPWSHRLKLFMAAAALAVGVLAAGAFMLLRTPQWYRPAGMSRDRINTVRGQLEESFEIITQRLKDRQSFSITLEGSYINEILGAGREMWPRAERIGGPLGTPCVAIEPDLIRLGARGEWGGVQSILNIELHPSVDDDYVHLIPGRMRAGSLPVPRSWLAGMVQSARALPLDADQALTRQLREVFEALLLDTAPARLPNRFYWPSGDIPFEIADITLGDGVLSLQISPLRR